MEEVMDAFNLIHKEADSDLGCRGRIKGSRTVWCRG